MRLLMAASQDAVAQLQSKGDDTKFACVVSFHIGIGERLAFMSSTTLGEYCSEDKDAYSAALCFGCALAPFCDQPMIATAGALLDLALLRCDPSMKRPALGSSDADKSHA